MELTNGWNHITLRVSDRAGNVTVTNLAVMLDYTSATNRKRHAERHWIISDNYHNSESYDKYEVF
ncbi:MAG TPA: hypothetical protein VFZ59_09685 [Verrucomicrobiae bacterium]|nr:hypothetical protein [Verrucomicrobiae bacterium]